MPDAPKVPTTNPLVVLQPTDRGAVLLDVASGDCFELNRVGLQMWTRLAAGESPETITAALAAEYHLPVSTLATDLDVLLKDLSRHGLLTSPR